MTTYKVQKYIIILGMRIKIMINYTKINHEP